MKHWLLTAALICFCSTAQAKQLGILPDNYLRPLDPSHLVIGGGFLLSPKALDKTYGVTDLALITHSPADGTLLPGFIQKYMPPVAWVPLHAGFGGSFRNEVIFDLGTSLNVSPAMAALLMKGIGTSSQPWLQAVKKAFECSGDVSIRIGGSLGGHLVKDGVFQSAKEFFPGQGVGEILGNASMLNFGVAWKL